MISNAIVFETAACALCAPVAEERCERLSQRGSD
jgi:hypothetical protein